MRKPKNIRQTFVILLGILIALLVFLAIHYDYPALGYTEHPVTLPYRIFSK